MITSQKMLSQDCYLSPICEVAELIGQSIICESNELVDEIEGEW